MSVYGIVVRHSTSTGHRIVGHEGKCRFLHGHNYEFQVEIRTPVLQDPGFVLDFGWVKTKLDQWDHKLVLWNEDPLYVILQDHDEDDQWGIRPVTFNPTSENMARYLGDWCWGQARMVLDDLEEEFPLQKNVQANAIGVSVTVWESGKNSGYYQIGWK